MEQYYVNQAGSGFAYYAGSRYQKGHGWFGRIFRSGILPLIKYVGRKSLKTGSNVIKDVIQGEDLRTAAKRHIKDTMHDVTDDAIDKISQRGSGKRKKFSKRSKLKVRKTKKVRKKRKTKKRNKKGKRKYRKKKTDILAWEK